MDSSRSDSRKHTLIISRSFTAMLGSLNEDDCPYKANQMMNGLIVSKSKHGHANNEKSSWGNLGESRSLVRL